MEFWKKKKSIDVNKPITNSTLKKSFQTFNLNMQEATLQGVINEIKKANFLVLIKTDELNYSKAEGSDMALIEKGSKIKFLKTFNESNESFLPVFTDWSEIDLWVESRENIAGWIMSTNEIFDFVLKNKNDKGLVINPCTDKWEMTKEQITTFIKESLN